MIASDEVSASEVNASINQFCKLLMKDKSSAVRCNAAKQLAIICCDNTIEEKLKQKVFKDLLKALDALYEPEDMVRYEAWQALGKIAKITNNSFRSSSMYLLHLSDLHFNGSISQADQWSEQLAADLQYELKCTKVEVLILSGDIGNFSTKEEYNAAEHFINKLCSAFQISSDHLIVVPGNHDLNWDLYEQCVYKDAQGNLKEDLEKRKRRFQNFIDFYEKIKSEPYPYNYEHQGILSHLPRQKLLFLSLNSAWKLDKRQTKDADICYEAVTKALDKIRRNQDFYIDCLKIAVWHHPFNSSGEDRIKDRGCLERLAQSGFRLALHGHIHQADNSLYKYDHSVNGRKIDVICAGTFGAPTKELVPAYPWQYNLLKLEEKRLTVYTRRREKENGTWKPDARWLQGLGQPPLDHFVIDLG